MAILLPPNVERGAMEPEIVKSAAGYKKDIAALVRIPSYRSTVVGCICSSMICGAATVFFPDFVSMAAVISGDVDPCVQDDSFTLINIFCVTEKKNIPADKGS